MRKARLNRLTEILTYMILSFGSILMVLPFLWMISTSLKDMGEVFLFPPRWIPQNPKWNNYLDIWSVLPFGFYLRNSVLVAVLTVFGQLFSASLTGFALARLDFPGRNLFFVTVLATMMVPSHVTLIPVFVEMKYLGWVDTFLPLIFPAYLGRPFSIFLMRQFFMTLPRELEDAARIDGANPFQMYIRIFLPLAKPVIATLTVITFMWSWNDLMQPVIYLNSPEKFTLPVGLAFLRNEFYANWPLLMTGAFMSILPILIAYILAQKYFVEGIAMTGLKG